MKQIAAIVDSGQTSPFFKNFLGGRFVREFEREFARYVGAKYAVSMANGTLALNAAYSAVLPDCGRVKPKIAVSPYTFVATVSELVRVGCEPVFVDVQNESGAIDLRKTVAVEHDGVVLMHPLGSPCDASTNDRFFVEDACQALGARFDDYSMCGTRARIGVFSFQQTKSASTGEGGMAVTNDDELYRRLCFIRNHGEKYGPFAERYSYMTGTNYRLTEIQAAIGLHALKTYDKLVKHQLMLGKIVLESIHRARWLYPQEPWSGNGYIFGSAISNFLCGPNCNSKRSYSADHAAAKGVRERFLKRVKRWNKGVPGKVIGSGYSELVYELPAFRSYFHSPPEQCPVAEMWRDHAVWFDIRQMSVDEVKSISREIERFK